MIKKNDDLNKIKELEKKISSKQIDESPIKDNNKENKNKFKYKKLQSEEIISSKNIINSACKNDSNNNFFKNIEINPKINKVKTYNIDQRKDRFGNMIIHGGKQKVTFIDKVSKSNFTDVVKIENFKQYNKMEEPSNNQGNNCCIIL